LEKHELEAEVKSIRTSGKISPDASQIQRRIPSFNNHVSQNLIAISTLRVIWLMNHASNCLSSFFSGVLEIGFWVAVTRSFQKFSKE